jgi:hypothetical protein
MSEVTKEVIKYKQKGKKGIYLKLSRMKYFINIYKKPSCDSR